ncbi:MAG: hypothetical protein Q4C54_06435 [Clostridia bacterium]|nr:hypothetical protein [Clostridia bacterium]
MRKFAALFSICFVLILCCVGVAGGEIIEGDCSGYDDYLSIKGTCTWTLDTSTGILSISGNWYPYLPNNKYDYSLVKKLILNEGVKFSDLNMFSL